MAFLPLMRLIGALWFLCASAVASPDIDNLYRSAKYAHGFRGAFPLQRYLSADVSGPILNYWRRSKICEDGKYTILAPRGDSIRHPGPMILDQEGHLVWFKELHTTYNANVYTYKGERYLTFWVGDDSIRGHGDGIYYMLNSHYEEVYKIKGASGLPADLHEFQITHDDTAVFAVYETRPMDLREVGGPEEGWIYDGVFQEVDVETNELLFQWRASEHFSFNEIERGREGNGESHDTPWDFFHLNSVDKDWRGNFLISSRYMSCLAYIDGKTGDVIWKLGGKQNSFKDLSDGAATNISWQHHARFHVEYDTNTTRAISIFDNASRGVGAPENPSRGLFIMINEEEMTVSVLQEFWNPQMISSQSQGSVQVLENGNVLVGYGYDAAWTEFSADGEALCEVNFGPQNGFGKGHTISYRVFKQDWVGLPLTKPSVALSDTAAAVSWLGATEVATWVLQGSLAPETDDETEEDIGNITSWSEQGPSDGKGKHISDRRIANPDAADEGYEFISAVPKTGFETSISIPPDALYTRLRIVALDKTGGFLGATKSLPWQPENMGVELGVFEGEVDEFSQAHIASPLMFGLGFLSATAIVVGAWLVCRFLVRGAWRRILTLRPSLTNEEQIWQAVASGDELEELDDLENLSDLETGDRVGDSLLKQPEE
ncbi:hypothetical protein N7462_010940 [Penicillium macrosclerotiorum]|uniref:uncharacterized protein n=1 Tax=Penicillium macrosclerotiorum TaxID=303699 RepID=UPI0025496343|nr:uncharacterized protein N7462_010940 [Penicillium macrosclerotiorum]KAJ5669870.1 hypothetical protein N7462_010940 [Penicillium macrosclerotiorum]